jgi:hypothetical protein
MRLAGTIAAILALTTPAFAQQAGKVSQMPFASTPLAGTELLYLVQNGISVKCTVTQCGLGGASNLTITDGTNTVPGTNHILFNNATVGGSTPNGTVTIPLLTVTDGTHTVANTKQLSVSGGTIGGTSPNATLTIPSGITLFDGVTEVIDATMITVGGMTVGGTPSSATLTVRPQMLFTDGTHTVAGSNQLTVSGGVIGGTSPDATLTIPVNTQTYTDGTHTVSGATQLTVTGGVIGGTTPNATLTITPGTTGVTFTDGTHTVSGATQLAVTGLTIGGTTPNATGSVNYATNSEIWAHASTTTAIDPAVAATSIAPQTFTESGGTFSIDFNSGINLELPLVHADCPCTIANPANVYAGLSGNMTLIQSATGSDTIGTWGTTWKFSGGVAPLLSTGANAIDVLPFYCRTTTFCVITLIANAQ